MYKNVRKKSKKAELDECIACALHPTYAIGIALGVSNIICTCQHSDKSLEKPTFKVSNLHQILSGFIIAVLALSVAWSAYILCTDKVEELNCLTVLSDMFYCCNGIVLIGGNVAVTHLKIKWLIGWTIIVERCRKQEMQSLLHTADVKALRTRTYIYCGIILSTLVVVLLHRMFNMELGLKWEIARSYSVLLSSVVHLAISFQASSEAALVGIIFNNWRRSLLNSLKQYFEKRGLYRTPDPSLKKIVVNMTHLYTTMMQNRVGANAYFGLSFVVFCIFVLPILVFDVFLVGEMLKSAHANTFIVMLEMRTAGIFLMLLNFLVCAQKVQDMSEDILSFLFKYPISKLSAAEAAQVEMLITTLNIQRPVLRASDIFTVGTRLLASISGTVVTYVLVALQFHASWAKD